MVGGMATTQKVTVTIPGAMVELAKATAASQDTNLSAYTAAALRDALLRDAMDQMIAEGYTPLGALHDEVATDLEVA